MLRKVTLGAVASLALSAVAFAQAQNGSAAEARAMLEKAVAAIKVDKAKAIEMFNKGQGGFLDRDLAEWGHGARLAQPFQETANA